MRRLAVSACTLLATATMIAVPVTEASAADLHSVNISGTLDIKDDESWPFSDERRTVNFNRTIAIGTNITEDTYVASGCAGGEVRVEATFRVVHIGTTVRVYPSVRMFEGTSCGNNDLDGSSSIPSFTVGTNSTVSNSMSVNNTDEGGDSATVRFSVRNQV